MASVLAGLAVKMALQKLNRQALPIAGDDKQSKDVVPNLVDDSGFDSFPIRLSKTLKSKRTCWANTKKCEQKCRTLRR
jgi:predicted dinucleotide-binding enzyme